MYCGDWKGLYDYTEEIDPYLPKPLLKPLSLTTYFDADLAHDTVTRKSMTGISVWVGRTPIIGMCRRQGPIETSTFGSEFNASRNATEEVIAARYMMRSFGIPVDKPTAFLGDNRGMLQNAGIASSVCRKKHHSISYNFVRQNTAAKVILPYWIPSPLNRADPFTKPLGGECLHGHNKAYYCTPGDWDRQSTK